MNPRIAILLSLISACPLAGGLAEEADLFESQVAPILERRCLSCHNAEQRKGGLALDSRTALLAGGDSGELIDLDSPTASLLLEYIRGDESARLLSTSSRWSVGIGGRCNH